ncbi:MAG TPA: helix-turn-helix domain-containing protein, partial [Chloroflexota bacterium]|nr:helix-turn-helix domain-containing protein [Chloroflexota bacterium]
MPGRPVSLNAEEHGALTAAQRQRRSVRHWRRYQAVVLRAEGMAVKQVAQSLGCTETSVSNWTAAYRRHGVDGVGEGRHPGAVGSWTPREQRCCVPCCTRAIRRRMA